MELSEIHKNIAVPFIQKYHYSKILPRLTKKYIGYYENDELVGIVTLGWGTQPLQTIKKIFYKHDYITTDYYEIGKMCFRPDKNGSNFGSKAISLLVQWLKDNTDIKFLYTMADGIMGKCGFVYQASNFKYIGSFKTDVYMDKNTGEKIHPRSAKQLLIQNAIFSNKETVFWLTHDFCEYKGIERIRGLMFRYMYPIDKRSRRVLNSYKEYRDLKNPKEEDLYFERRVESGVYEEIPQPNFNMDVFNYNFQDYSENDNADKFFEF